MELDSLTLNEKIGQRFIFGVNSKNIDCITKLIKSFPIGGVILYKSNYTNYNDMLSVIRRLKDANKGNKIPLFIGIDQEAGKVNRLPDEIHSLKNVYDVSKKDISLLKNHAEVIGEILYHSGININFAPVLDIYNDSNSKALYKRCFYGDGERVYKSGLLYINELKKQNIIPVGKHFPGHGASKIDSHFLIPYVFNYSDVLDNHMKPFEKLMDSDLDFVMVGHLCVNVLTNGLPASISRNFIKKYLREKNDFKGLIITDEINMLKRNPFYRFIYLKKAFDSCSDILLIKIKSLDEAYKIIDKYKRCYNALELDDAVNRILMMKKKYKINDNLDFKGIDIDKINKEIDYINNQL